ncbi:MAG TPA: peptidylprolyl isomerase, partial [Acidobacteriaceae bacterium]
LDEGHKVLLRDLIDTQLLLSKGKELDISGENETVRQLDELRKQNHLDSMEALQKAAEEQGVSFEDFKASIRNRVITSQVIREEVGRRINISAGEEQQFYDAHKADFERQEQVQLSEILVPTANADDAGQVASAKAKADELEKQLKAGKDFAAVAKTGSGGPTAAQGGLIGDFKRGQLAKVLEDQTFGLPVGQWTDPIRTKQGWVILKVNEHQAAGLAPFKDVEGQIQDELGMEKMNPALRVYLTRLREEAYISIKPGYVDSGASPHQESFVFSAYQPPQPKKRKKLDRTRYGGRGRTVTHPAVQQASAAPLGPALPAGVPTLAEVPQGPSGSSATTPAGTAAPPPAPANRTVAAAGTMKAGKKEKIRFGQAPRETLPAGPSQSEDAGAAAANGNGSSVEQQVAAGQVPPSPAGAAPAGARYTTGESATEDAVPGPEQKKTRYAARAALPKVKKVKNKDKVDPFAPAPADSDEVATKQTQAAPLGMNGDTSKKPAKVKATGPKTRYADETKEEREARTAAEDKAQNAATPPDSALRTPSAPSAGAAGPAAQDGPASPAGPSANPDAHAPNGEPAPVPTQATPNGTGDPLGPTVPTSPTPQGATPPQGR